MKCCGGVYNGHKGCVSDAFTKDKSKDGKVIFQNILKYSHIILQMYISTQ